MKKIKFEDLPSENTPINSANLDTLQNNIEESAVIVSSTEPTTKEKVWFQKSKNLLDNKATSQKINGITYTVNPDKTVTANGKATGMSILFLTESNATLEKGNYNITDGVGDYTNYFTQLTVNNPTQGEQFINTGFKYDFSISEKSKLGVKIIIRDGVTVNNLKFKPMLVKQENKNIPYEPYLTKKILTKTNGVFEEFYNEEKKENYSLAEQRIGTWINGKPLYRKVIEKEFPEIQDGVEETLEITLNGINFVIVESYWAERTYEKILNQGPYPNVIQQKYTSLSNNTIIRFSTTKSYLSNRKIMIIIKYTKATD